MDSKRTPGAARGAEPSGPRTRRPHTATRRWRLRRVLCLLMLCGGSVTSIEPADPQPYRVEFASTGNAALDATLKATSQLEALRSAAPVSPFGLLARARAVIGRLKTALESAGYYQSSVAVTINGAPLEEPSLGATLGELPAGAEALCKIAFSLGP